MTMGRLETNDPDHFPSHLFISIFIQKKKSLNEWGGATIGNSHARLVLPWPAHLNFFNNFQFFIFKT